jgi:predicted nucleic acid-binding protein
MSAPAFVVDASVVVRWLVEGPFTDACQSFLDRCGQLDARLLAPTCLYSEVANALYRLCLATPPREPLPPPSAMRLFRSLPDYEIALVDHARRSASGELGLAPQWEQMPDGTVRDYRIEIYARGIDLSYPSRRGSLFDMAYAALAEQAATTMWTIDERFYNGARAQGLARVMHPGMDPLP